MSKLRKSLQTNNIDQWQGKEMPRKMSVEKRTISGFQSRNRVLQKTGTQNLNFCFCLFTVFLWLQREGMKNSERERERWKDFLMDNFFSQWAIQRYKARVHCMIRTDFVGLSKQV